MIEQRQYHLPLPVQDSMGVEDFLISSANAEAALLLLERTPASWSSHTLLLWGASGSGKTHLLSIWSEKNKASRIKVGSDDLQAVIDGAQDGNAFALDDVDACVGDPSQEEWLQHFYNATKTASCAVLMTASKPVAAWGLGLRDIETRLKSCASVQLHEPDDDLMHGLLLKLFSDRQLLVEAGVVDFLAMRLERTGTSICHAVAVLDEAALETGRKISIPFAQKVLKF